MKWVVLVSVSVAIIFGFFEKKHVFPAPFLNYVRNATFSRNIQPKISYLRDHLSNMIKGGSEKDENRPLNAEFYDPVGIYVDSFGQLYFSERGNHVIRLIADGKLTSIAGNCQCGFSGDGQRACSVRLNYPGGLAGDRKGSLLIADSGNHRIRMISNDGSICTIAGTGIQSYSGDGHEATKAQLNSPQAVFVTNSKEIYINDEHNHQIRKILPSGLIITIAGNGRAGYCGDGGLAINACLYDPEGIWVDDSKNLFITDGDNHRIRKVNPNGIITTIAGSGNIGKYKDRYIYSAVSE